MRLGYLRVSNACVHVYVIFSTYAGNPTLNILLHLPIFLTAIIESLQGEVELVSPESHNLNPMNDQTASVPTMNQNMVTVSTVPSNIGKFGYLYIMHLEIICEGILFIIQHVVKIQHRILMI
jgi:hypothetical protein